METTSKSVLPYCNNPGEWRGHAKAPQKREESNFETSLSVALSYLKCSYIKIPDPIYNKARVKKVMGGENHPSRRRPFDGMIVTNADDAHTGGIYAVEAKYNNNTLEPHQLNYLTMVNKANGMGYVIRKSVTKNKEKYTVEWPEKNVLYETDNLINFAMWFKNLSLVKK